MSSTCPQCSRTLVPETEFCPCCGYRLCDGRRSAQRSIDLTLDDAPLALANSPYNLSAFGCWVRPRAALILRWFGIFIAAGLLYVIGTAILV